MGYCETFPFPAFACLGQLTLGIFTVGIALLSICPSLYLCINREVSNPHMGAINHISNGQGANVPSQFFPEEDSFTLFGNQG